MTNGKEGYEATSVDEGRCENVEDDGAREGENNGDRAQAQAKLGRNASEGNEAWRNAWGSSKSEKQFDRLAAEVMKTILIPAEDHDAMPAVLETARLVARRFDAYMEGFAVHPAAADFVAVDPLSSLTMTHIHDRDAEIERQARGLFEAFMAEHDVPRAPARYLSHLPPEHARAGNDVPQPARFSWGWPWPAVQFDAFIGSHGRLFDLIVLGRPGRLPQNPRMAPLETALFESGHPVLIAPPAPPKSLGRNILVAWNGSTEQARTNAFALPLFREAERVTVLTVEGGMTPGPTGEEVALHLCMNGVRAQAVNVPPGARSTGESILDHAASLGCDLLVKGAYTQSRLRQMVFGGTTRHILAHATLPVLMAH